MVKLKKEIDELNTYIKDKNYDEALKLVRNMQKLNKEFDIKFALNSSLIDIGFGKKDAKIIEEGLSLLKKLENIPKDYESIRYSNLGNAYLNLYELKYNKNRGDAYFKYTELDKAIEYYSKSLNFNPNNLNCLVNLGNAFDNEGLFLNALELYDKSLEINDKFSLGLLNKGITLLKYSKYTENYPVFIKEAYKYLTECKEYSLDSNSMDIVNQYINHIEKKYNEYIKRPDNKKKYEIKNNDKFEDFYINYILKNKLYINMCNYCQKCENSIGDSLFINRMVENLSNKGKSSKKYFTYLNQIKEDYISSRFLLILSRSKDILNLKFVDKKVLLIDTLEYKEYNIYLQLLMLSFKNMYDILDKIAFFINDYLNLEMKEYDINFKKIWYEYNKKVRSKISKTKNPNLNAIYKTHINLKENNKKLNEIRNALTHRFIEIKYEVDENSFSEKDLEEKTIKLSKIVKNAIIYLILFVNNEEYKKFKNIKEIPKIKVNKIPDEIKNML